MELEEPSPAGTAVPSALTPAGGPLQLPPVVAVVADDATAAAAGTCTSPSVLEIIAAILSIVSQSSDVDSLSLRDSAMAAAAESTLEMTELTAAAGDLILGDSRVDSGCRLLLSFNAAAAAAVGVPTCCCRFIRVLSDRSVMCGL